MCYQEYWQIIPIFMKIKSLYGETKKAVAKASQTYKDGKPGAWNNDLCRA